MENLTKLDLYNYLKAVVQPIKNKVQNYKKNKAENRWMLEAPFKGFESSSATSHGNISDLYNSVHSSGRMAAGRPTIMN